MADVRQFLCSLRREEWWEIAVAAQIPMEYFCHECWINNALGCTAPGTESCTIN